MAQGPHPYSLSASQKLKRGKDPDRGGRAGAAPSSVEAPQDKVQRNPMGLPQAHSRKSDSHFTEQH